MLFNEEIKETHFKEPYALKGVQLFSIQLEVHPISFFLNWRVTS